MELKILLLLVIVLICLIPIIYDPKPTPRQKSTISRGKVRKQMNG